MKLRKFNDYKHYKEEQIKTNKRKIKSVTIKADELDSISNYIKKKIPHAKCGICHGTRNGVEQAGFRKRLGINVIGTEISPTAKQFPNTIQWDFHRTKPKWKDKFDFIYSNSLDHSFDPDLAFQKWLWCLHPKGRLFIEWSGFDSVELFDKQTDYADCFGASREEYRQLFERNGGTVEDVLQHKSKDKCGRRITFVVKKVSK